MKFTTLARGEESCIGLAFINVAPCMTIDSRCRARHFKPRWSGIPHPPIDTMGDRKYLIPPMVSLGVVAARRMDITSYDRPHTST